MIRAARLREPGAPVVVEEVELPDPAPDEVLVELRFGGVNPVDRYVAEGRVAPDGPLPRTLGAEAAGLVDGRAVLVAGGGLGSRRDGVWAQAAVVPASATLELPQGVELQDAAAMGVAGLTAYTVVRDLAEVGAEDRVLVLGASGGVGTMIVSLASAAGATVWGQTGSEDKGDVIREQGAERVVVAGPDELADALGSLQPTVVFDPLGDGYVAPVLDAVTPRARIVSFGTSAGPQVELNMQTLYRKGLSVRGYAGLIVGPEERRQGLQAALGALAAGELRVVIDEVLPLDQVNEAFRRLAERGVRGKLLLALE
ncbi:MAG: zinc-binding alcohol dehydrogenase family protein [Solirubrobacteraceae bacterium]